MDTRVTLLELADTLWTRAVGPEMGRFFEAFLRDRGVHVRTRTRAERLEGRDSIEAVVLPDGTRLAADLVVIGVGVRPDTDLAERAGLPVDNGILVDQQLRAADGVFAAGDVANVEHPLFRRIRIEHWAEALNQGCWPAGTWPGPASATTASPTSSPTSSTCHCPTWAMSGNGTSWWCGAAARSPSRSSSPGTCATASHGQP
jgi:hypothetical protein